MAEQSICSFDGCDKPVKARGHCPRHYQRILVHGDPSIVLPVGGAKRGPSKPCSRCDRQIPRTREFFSTSSQTKDGLHPSCNACLAEARRERRASPDWKCEEVAAKADAPFKACSIEGCPNNAHWRMKGVRGWCSAHYAKFLKYGSPTAGRPRSRRLDGSSCSRCVTDKPRTIEFFYPDADRADGVSPHCRECGAKREREIYAADPERARQSARRYRERNPERHKENQRRQREKRTPQERLSAVVRSRVSGTIAAHRDGARRPWRRRDWISDLGYTEADLIAHIERQFRGRMSWQNYGTYWHVDHIVPLSEFRYESYADPEIRAAWALSNLRPLEKSKNLQKSSKRTHLL